ncbi:MAG: aquaporin Z [Chitinophagales bacterium]|nr:aquaporin Z [Chitinophagales bacterium]
MKKLIAEFLGTFWLVLGGCGSAVLAAKFVTPEGVQLGIGFLGVSLAFGLTVVTGAYAFGPISGGHFNPAVSIGAWVANRLNIKDLFSYIAFQITGAIVAAIVLYIIATGNGGSIGGFATNGYGAASPGGYSMMAAIVCEFVMTFIFLIVILFSTDEKANGSFAGLTIGLTLTLIHLISIPVTNTSVNPARSISQAVFVGGEALNQLWLFILVPIIGAACAGFVYKLLRDK